MSEMLMLCTRIFFMKIVNNIEKQKFSFSGWSKKVILKKLFSEILDFPSITGNAVTRIILDLKTSNIYHKFHRISEKIIVGY